jgi:hypothetical protein
VDTDGHRGAWAEKEQSTSDRGGPTDELRWGTGQAGVTVGWGTGRAGGRAIDWGSGPAGGAVDWGTNLLGGAVSGALRREGRGRWWGAGGPGGAIGWGQAGERGHRWDTRAGGQGRQRTCQRAGSELR